jgi:hypothetical protein
MDWLNILTKPKSQIEPFALNTMVRSRWRYSMCKMTQLTNNPREARRWWLSGVNDPLLKKTDEKYRFPHEFRAIKWLKRCMSCPLPFALGKRHFPHKWGSLVLIRRQWLRPPQLHSWFPWSGNSKGIAITINELHMGPVWSIQVTASSKEIPPTTT